MAITIEAPHNRAPRSQEAIPPEQDFSMLAEGAQSPVEAAAPQPDVAAEAPVLDAAAEAPGRTRSEFAKDVAGNAFDIAKNAPERLIPPPARFAGKVAVRAALFAATRSPGMFVAKRVAKAGYNSITKPR